MKSSKVLGAILGLSLLLGSAGVVLAAPFDFESPYRNSTDTADLNLALTPPDTSPDTAFLMGFRTTHSGVSKYDFFNIGSGIGVSANTIFATINTIETPDGFLVDTLNNKVNNSTYNSFVSATNATLSGLGTPFDIQKFFGSASSTADIASSSPGLMSAAMVTKLNGAGTSTVAVTGAYSDLTGKPSLATVATSGSYADLISKPTLGASYEGTTQRTSSFPIFKSATVASGVAVVNLTSDGTAGGTALCSNGVIQDSVSVIFNDNSSSFQQSWAFSNSNKTLTVTANKFTSANILSGLLGQAAANGSVAKISVWCY